MNKNLLNRSSTNEATEISGGLRCGRSGSLLLGFVLAIVSAGPAMAGPTGGQVVGGEGTITHDSNLTRIDQASSRISINWDTFNVAANETVRFVQPSSTSVALNTIFDQSPSQIFGVIDANGRVLLINPNGMIFGATAQVNVAGLVASSLNISTADFMAGDYSFESAGGSGGLVLNQGALQAAPGGFIALLGEAVANEGLIVADAGTIAMGSGTKAALDFDGSGLLYFQVESEVLNNALGLESGVSNTGSLVADGGQVLLTAAAEQDVYTRAINNHGLIQARRIENEGGVIRLSGGLGTTVISGVLDASGDVSSDGGSIHVTGNYVGLAGDATLIADGGQNGGQILVGGGYQGNDANVQNAERAYVGDGVSISANAGANGDGGEVIVWSDDITRYHGSISATGGSTSGNGGNAEVSGAVNLSFDGFVDLTANNGTTGQLLLDPALLTILGGDGGGGAAGGLNGNLPDLAFADTNGDDAVTADALELLDADIFLRAEDSIVVGDLTDFGGDGDINIAFDRNITLETRNSTADGDSAGSISFVNTNNSIITNGTGSITITAGTVGTEGASITSTGELLTEGGNVTLAAAGDITVTADIDSLDGTINITADDSVTIATGTTVDAGSGDVSVRVDNNDNSTDTLVVLGNISSSGTVTLTGSATDANDVLQGSDNGDTWVTDGANTGTLNGWDFDDFANLQGGTGADTFSMGTADFGGTLVGGAGDDQFNVNVNQSGTLNGGEGSDTFALADGVVMSFAGTAIDGGADAAGDDTDTLNVSAYTGALAVVLTGSTANTGFAGTEATVFTGAGGEFDGIDAIDASLNFGNTLTGRDVDSTWTYSSYSDGTETLNFAGEGTLIGGAGTQTLQGDDGGVDTADVFITDGLGFVTLFDQDFVNIDVLNGLNGNDTFNLTVADFGGTISGGTGNDLFNVIVSQSGIVDGGAGSDEIVGVAGANTFVVNAADAGTVNGTAFTGVENLTGGAAADTFTFTAALTGTAAGLGGNDTFNIDDGGSAGTIDGGAGTDTQTYAGSTGPVTVSVAGLSSIETLIGSGNVGDTLQGTAGADTFTTSGADAGTVNGALNYSAFENLSGLGGNDVFNLLNAVTGTVDGGADTDAIVGVAGANTFVVNAANAGTVNGTAFAGVENLTGGAAADTFTFTAALTGTAAGLGGNDTFNINDGGSAGTIDGGAGTDTQTYAGSTGPVTVSVAGLSSIETLIGSGNVGDTLQGTAGADTFTTSGADAGTVNGALNYSAFENLAGLGGNDVFNLLNAVTGTVDGGADTDAIVGVAGANTFVVNAANAGTVNGTAFAGVENLTGGAAADTFTFTAALTGTAAGLGGNDTFNINDGGSAGTIDGGAGTDTASFAGRTTAVTVGIDTFVSIESLVGSAQSDTLEGTAGNDAFTVFAADAGDASGVAFSSFENLAGQGGDDTFNMNAGVSGTVDGGADTDAIVGVAGANTFVVNAANAGTVNGTAFTGVENLTGGAAADTFTLTAALTGTASGLAGDDNFNVGDNGDANLIDGGSGTDSLSYAARTSGVIVDMAVVNAVEIVTGSNFDDTFNLNGDEDNDIDIDGNGSAGSDLFTVVSNSQVTGDLDVGNVDEVQIGADVTANNIVLSVNGAITGAGSVFAQSLTTSSIGGQSIFGAVGTFDAENSGNGDIDLSNSGDLDVLGIVQSGGGDISVGTASELTQSGNITADGGSISMSAANGSLTMAQTAETNSNGGDIDYETTGAGGDITLGLLQTCDDCQVAGSTGAVTVTAVGDILGQPRLGGQPHITAVTATLRSGGQIGSDPNSGGTPIVFTNMALNGPEGEAPIMLEASGDSFIISGNRKISSTGRVFDQSAGSRETAASAQAASQEEEEEVDWAAYSEDITVYEINNEGVQLPEEEEADDFVKIENEGVNIPIASIN